MLMSNVGTVSAVVQATGNANKQTKARCCYPASSSKLGGRSCRCIVALDHVMQRPLAYA